MGNRFAFVFRSRAVHLVLGLSLFVTGLFLAARLRDTVDGPPRWPHLYEAVGLAVAFLAGLGLRPPLARTRRFTLLLGVLDLVFSPNVELNRLRDQVAGLRSERNQLREQLRTRARRRSRWGPGPAGRGCEPPVRDRDLIEAGTGRRL